MSKTVKEPFMRTRNKYAISAGLGLALCAMMIYGCCCRVPKPTPDRLAGWQMDFSIPPIDHLFEKDWKDYIHTLSPGEQRYTHIDSIYKNGKGQHAVKIEIDIDGKDCWYHVLFYDKDNKRVKVVKYFFGRYVSQCIKTNSRLTRVLFCGLELDNRYM